MIALLRGWNPRDSAVPVARASLEDLCLWTGLSKGQQSEVVRELVEGWKPQLVKVLVESARGSARLYGLSGFVDLAAATKVRRAERIPDAMRPAGGTDGFGRRNGTVRPAERNRSAGGTQSSVETPETLDTETEEGITVKDLDDEALRHAMVALPSSDKRKALAATEWARRSRERRRRRLDGNEETA